MTTKLVQYFKLLQISISAFSFSFIPACMYVYCAPKERITLHSPWVTLLRIPGKNLGCTHIIVRTYLDRICNWQHRNQSSDLRLPHLSHPIPVGKPAQCLNGVTSRLMHVRLTVQLACALVFQFGVPLCWHARVVVSYYRSARGQIILAPASSGYVLRMHACSRW